MRKVFLLIAAIVLLCEVSSAQVTAFTYQGSLKISDAPANGNYDFQFTLWTDASGGTQVGGTNTLNGRVVTNGIFSVTLEFGNQFPGSQRFLEVRVRPTGGGAFTTLTPRERIKAVPYSVTSLNSEQLGGVPANQYITNANGAASFIHNTTTQQATSNFNISGNGTAGGTLTGGIVNAGTHFNLDGSRILSSPNLNLFVGFGAGQAQTSGEANTYFGPNAGLSTVNASDNAFFGSNSGRTNVAGIKNSFFGAFSGNSNTNGSLNSFFGEQAGYNNTIGNNNSFFGSGAGQRNIEGSQNAFFGFRSGFNNTTAISNSFFGYASGAGNTTGSSNSFFGESAGENTNTGGGNLFVGARAGSFNTTGQVNTIVGTFADFSNNNLSNATAIGYRALASQSNSLILGGVGGSNGCTAANLCDSVNVGIGTTTPQQTLHVNGLEVLSTGPQSGFKFRSRGSTSSGDDWVWYANLNIARLFKAGTGDLLTIQPTGEFAVNVLGTGGSVGICRNALNQIATCSSSLRYKTNIGEFSQGLSFINKLRPISFDWLDGGMKDVGFGAEEIAKIDARFVTYNSKGEVEGVKYDRLSVAFVNAIKEQQEVISGQQSAISDLRAVSGEQARKIDDQNSKIEVQQKQIDDLKMIVCSLKPDAKVCKEKYGK